jgi:predicted membrane-bound mannosyltransferase
MLVDMAALKKCRNVNSLREILSKYACLYFQPCVMDHSQIMSVDLCALAFFVAVYFIVRILAAASRQCVTLLMMLQ